MTPFNGPAIGTPSGIPVAAPITAPVDSTAALGQAGAPITLPQDRIDDLTKMLQAAIEYHGSKARPFFDKAEQWLEMFQVIPKEKNKPWPGSSNFPVPFIAEKIMSIHARLVRAIFNVDPIWLVKARIPEQYEVSTHIERFLDYLVDRGGYRGVLDLAILYALIEGTAVVKIDYKRDTRHISSSNPQVAQELGTLSADGVSEQFTEFEGPRATFVPLRDFMVVPIDRFDLDDVQGCGHRFWLTASQLTQREKDGIYANAQELVDKRAKGDDPKTPANPIFGQLTPPPDEVMEPYELWELFWHYDLEGDGNEVPVLITYSKEANLVLRVIAYPYDHGKAPYVAIRPIPQPNLFYGVALSQYLEPIQRELTASFQRRGDALARATMPPILRLRGSAWNPTEEPLLPAGVITVNDPGEIQALQLPDFRQSNVGYEQMLIAFGERLTGISDFQLGRSPGGNRTFGEVRSILSEGEVRIDVMLARIHEGMRRIAELTWDIAYQFLPYGGLMNIGTQFFKITREMMRPPGLGFEAYEFYPNGTLSEASREQQMERNLVIANQMFQNQLLMDPQLNPQAPFIAALLMRKVLLSAGWQDADKYLPQIAQYQQAQQQGVPNPMEQQMMQAQQQQQAAMAQQQQMEQARLGIEQQNAQSNSLKAAGQVAPQIAQMLGGLGGPAR